MESEPIDEEIVLGIVPAVGALSCNGSLEHLSTVSPLEMSGKSHPAHCFKSLAAVLRCRGIISLCSRLTLGMSLSSRQPFRN